MKCIECGTIISSDDVQVPGKPVLCNACGGLNHFHKEIFHTDLFTSDEYESKKFYYATQQ